VGRYAKCVKVSLYQSRGVATGGLYTPLFTSESLLDEIKIFFS
jgi:hypothetical protein